MDEWHGTEEAEYLAGAYLEITGIDPSQGANSGRWSCVEIDPTAVLDYIEQRHPGFRADIGTV